MASQRICLLASPGSLDEDRISHTLWSRSSSSNAWRSCSVRLLSSLLPVSCMTSLLIGTLRPSVEDFVQALRQLARAERLVLVFVDLRLVALFLVRRLAAGGQHDDVNLLGLRVRLQRRRDLVA